MAAKKLETMCKELEEDLVLYYYGEIADEEKRRLEQHLGDCGGCSRFIEDLHLLLPQMAPPEELPQSFWDDYYWETIAKLRHQREQKFYWRNLFVPMDDSGVWHGGYCRSGFRCGSKQGKSKFAVQPTAGTNSQGNSDRHRTVGVL